MTKEIVETRLAAADGAHFNRWPKMEVARTDLYILDDAKTAYRAGQLLGYAQKGVLRQLRGSDLPYVSGVEFLSWNAVWFYLDHAAGQSDDVTTRNLVAVVEGNFTRGQPAVLVEWTIGCQHDYAMRHLGPCYRTGTCVKCGHKFTVDSGD